MTHVSFERATKLIKKKPNVSAAALVTSPWLCCGLLSMSRCCGCFSSPLSKVNPAVWSLPLHWDVHVFFQVTILRWRMPFLSFWLRFVLRNAAFTVRQTDWARIFVVHRNPTVSVMHLMNPEPFPFCALTCQQAFRRNNNTLQTALRLLPTAEMHFALNTFNCYVSP